MPFIGGGSVPPDLLERVQVLEEATSGGSGDSAITISTTEPAVPTPVWIKLPS